jgi:hypothetical protein
MAYKEWTTQEYEIVVNHNQLSDQALADLLPGRTAGAVGATRAVIHNYHRGGHPNFQPSRQAQSWLEERRSTLTCPTCGTRF